MFLKSLGKILAAIGSGALKGALFVSSHPEVVASVANVAVQLGANAKTTQTVVNDATLVSGVTAGVAQSIDQAKKS